jgi:hypothetical protein
MCTGSFVLTSSCEVAKDVKSGTLRWMSGLEDSMHFLIFVGNCLNLQYTVLKFDQGFVFRRPPPRETTA